LGNFENAKAPEPPPELMQMDPDRALAEIKQRYAAR
jgi:hypothetical protein